MKPNRNGMFDSVPAIQQHKATVCSQPFVWRNRQRPARQSQFENARFGEKHVFGSTDIKLIQSVHNSHNKMKMLALNKLHI